MPHISVIIPTYNRLLRLQHTLESVVAQTYQDFDVWVVDDGSSDGSLDFLKAWSLRDPRFHYLRLEENKGVSAARNLGIKSSKGEWIALLDSDDLWFSEKLFQQAEHLKNNPDCVLIHTDEEWIRNGVKINPPKRYKKSGGEIFSDCFEVCKISPSTSLIKRSVLEEVGLFREDFPVCEDFELWLRITRNYRVDYIDQTLIQKTGGHEDQLSMRFHSMDYWRTLALSFYLGDHSLAPEIRTRLIDSIQNKCRILLLGFEKHQNFEKREEVLNILAKAQDSHLANALSNFSVNSSGLKSEGIQILT